MVKWNSAKIKDIARHRKESVTISDTECKLTAEIKKGVAGNEEIEAGELENLITTRHKRGYMLNCAKENVLTLTKAASTIHPAFGAAIVVNNEEAPWRINFTLAHELFHISTWDTFSPTEMEADEQLFKEIERKADRFASTLLLPEAEVRQELVRRVVEDKLSFSDIVDVAREFGVSTPALLFRMANLRLVPWEKADELSKNDELTMIDRRLRKDSLCETPISERFILRSVKCLRKGLISRGKFAEILQINRTDIDELLGYQGLTEMEGESVEIVAS